MIKELEERVLNNKSISRNDASLLTSTDGMDVLELFISACRIRKRFRGDEIELCSIVNAKSGACPEDCSFCAQSIRHKTDIPVYPLVNKSTVIEKAKEAKDAGVSRFCVVISGKKANKNEIIEIGSMVEEIRKIGLLPCTTLGILNRDELNYLRDRGLVRYHHNLETSERFFHEICSTHTYSDKLRTIESAKMAGLSVCSGGIFGMGEEWEDRIDMAFRLRELDIDSVPVNFLIPVKGTPLEEMDMLHPFEALKIVALYRFILPEKEIRICGGRPQVLGEFHSFIFLAGADSILTGNYLTTTGRTYRDDLRLIELHNLKIKDKT